MLCFRVQWQISRGIKWISVKSFLAKEKKIHSDFPPSECVCHFNGPDGTSEAGTTQMVRNSCPATLGWAVTGLCGECGRRHFLCESFYGMWDVLSEGSSSVSVYLTGSVLWQEDIKAFGFSPA